MKAICVEIHGPEEAVTRAVEIPLYDREQSGKTPFPVAGLRLGHRCDVREVREARGWLPTFLQQRLVEALPMTEAPPMCTDPEGIVARREALEAFEQTLGGCDPETRSNAVRMASAALGLGPSNLPVPEAWANASAEVDAELARKRAAQAAAAERARRAEEEATKPRPVVLGPDTFFTLEFDPTYRTPNDPYPSHLVVGVGGGFTEQRERVLHRWPYRRAPLKDMPLPRFGVRVRTKGTESFLKGEIDRAWEPCTEIVDAILAQRGPAGGPMTEADFGDGLLSSLVGRAKAFYFEHSVLAEIEPARAREHALTLLYCVEAGIRGLRLRPEVVSRIVFAWLSRPVRETYEERRDEARRKLVEVAGDQNREAFIGLPGAARGAHVAFAEKLEALHAPLAEDEGRELAELRRMAEFATVQATHGGRFFAPGALFGKSITDGYRDEPLADERDPWLDVLAPALEGRDQIHRSDVWDLLAGCSDAPDGAASREQNERLTKALRALGFEPKVIVVEGSQRRMFVRGGQ